MKGHVFINLCLAIIFFLNSDIPGRPGRKRIIGIILDRDQFATRRDNFNPSHGTIEVDESDLRNQSLVADLCNSLAQKDYRGFDKYTVNTSSQIVRTGGWLKRPRVYTPSADVVVPLQRSAERTEFEDNRQQMLNTLNTMAQSTNANDRALAIILRRLINLDGRRERPN